MKKIKVKPEKKFIGKEIEPVSVYNKHKDKVLNYFIAVIVVVLCVLAVFTWRQNKQSSALNMIVEARNLFGEKKYEASLTVYKEFVKKFPRHGLAPAALLGEAYCLEELGKKPDARDAFLKVQKKFSKSPWETDAAKGVERIKLP